MEAKSDKKMIERLAWIADQNYPISVVEFAEKFGLSYSGASRYLKQLNGLGYILRYSDGYKRRCYAITKEGLRLVIYECPKPLQKLWKRLMRLWAYQW